MDLCSISILSIHIYSSDGTASTFSFLALSFSLHFSILIGVTMINLTSCVTSLLHLAMLPRRGLAAVVLPRWSVWPVGEGRLVLAVLPSCA